MSFLNNLPHNLIESFKASLEEAVMADDAVAKTTSNGV